LFSYLFSFITILGINGDSTASHPAMQPIQYIEITICTNGIGVILQIKVSTIYGAENSAGVFLILGIPGTCFVPKYTFTAERSMPERNNELLVFVTNLFPSILLQ
jgi:hypothetical protein